MNDDGFVARIVLDHHNKREKISGVTNIVDQDPLIKIIRANLFA